MASIGNVFLSRSKAQELFGTEDPIGRTINMDRMLDLTVRGVYEDVPGNVSFSHNMVISLPTLEQGVGYGVGTWQSQDMYFVLVRLHRAADLEEANRQVTAVMGKYRPTEWKDGRREVAHLLPIKERYWQSDERVQRLVLLGVLGFSIFFVAGMNYVLAAVATIGRRAKMVGVHKCSGAGGGRILGMFLFETGLMMVASVVCALLLMLLFKEPIEDLLGVAHLHELFTWQTLWVPLLTVLLLFVVAGVLPGRMFSRIPVTLVFKRYTDDKRSWKVGLLFLQFLGVAVILGLLMTSAWQHHELMTRSAGFKDECLVTGGASGVWNEVSSRDQVQEQALLIAADLRRLPYVEQVGVSEQALFGSYSSHTQKAEGEQKQVYVQFQYFAKGFPETAQFELLEGTLPQQPGEALITESYARSMNWKDQVIGRVLGESAMRRGSRSKEGARVTGVIKDVRNQAFYGEESNIAFILDPDIALQFHVRLKGTPDETHETMVKLNEYVQQTYPATGLMFVSYGEIRRRMNADTGHFRNTVYITSGCILLIVLLGLIGYVSNETQRRSKEIAIRKVNGAEASDILRLLSADILKVAVGAVLIGIGCSYYISGIWMEQFPGSTLLSALWFFLLGVLILALIVLVVVVKARRIANENPVRSIISE